MRVPPDLLAGYRRFREDSFAREAGRYRALASTQNPRTMVIGCADSRVDPATIFSAAPGELFIVRNIAALVRRSRRQVPIMAHLRQSSLP